MAVCTTLGEASLRSSSPWAAPQGSDPRLRQAVDLFLLDGRPRPDLRLVQGAAQSPPSSLPPPTHCAARTQSRLARPTSDSGSSTPTHSALVVPESLSSETTTRTSPKMASRKRTKKRHPTPLNPPLPLLVDSLSCRSIEHNELATACMVCSPPSVRLPPPAPGVSPTFMHFSPSIAYILPTPSTPSSFLNSPSCH